MLDICSPCKYQYFKLLDWSFESIWTICEIDIFTPNPCTPFLFILFEFPLKKHTEFLLDVEVKEYGHTAWLGFEINIWYFLWLNYKEETMGADYDQPWR